MNIEVKVFWCKANEIERRLNEWLKKAGNIEILHAVQSHAKGIDAVLTIFYQKEKK